MAPKASARSKSKSRNRTASLSPTTKSEPPGTSQVPDTAAEPASASHGDDVATESVKTRDAKAPPKGRLDWLWQRWIMGLLGALVVLLLGLVVLGREWGYIGMEPPRDRHPCACVVPAADVNRLAKVMLSRRVGISGAHWIASGAEGGLVDFTDSCGAAAAVVPLSATIRSVDELRTVLQAPFQQRNCRCVVWVASPQSIAGVANALKELLENNALRGVPVVPENSRGIFVVKSEMIREQLKEMLPHRVVHMMSEVQ